MPYKPKKPCAYPGCPRLTHDRYCEEHAKLEARSYERFQRNPETTKRYGAAWRKIRGKYINEHPFCEICRREGRITPAQIVHHITPLNEGGTHAVDNLMSLCSSCHSKLHASRGDRWRNHG